MKKALSVAVAVAVLGTALSAEILEQVLVKVNGEIVTQTEFHRIQLAALREMPNQPDPSRLSDAELSKTLAQITPQAIVTVIDEMLLMQRAKELGLAVGDAQFAQVLESIKKDNKIESDEAFEKVAAEVSDAPSKANGGLIGPISRDEMNEELLKMISKMKVGELTPVLNTATGAQFFKLESSIESTALSFEAARARIADRLTSEKIGVEFQKYMQRLRSQALIEWKNEDLKKAWEIGIAAEPTF